MKDDEKKVRSKWVSKNFSKLDDHSQEGMDNDIWEHERCRSCGSSEEGVRGFLRGRKTMNYYTYPDLRVRGKNSCSHCNPWKTKNLPIKVYHHTCKECDIDFESKAKKSKFCSTKCRSTNTNRSNLKRYNKVCVSCEKDFIATRSTIRACSERCKKDYFNAEKRVDLTITNCKYCDKEITGRKNIKFCNQDCSNKHYQSTKVEVTERKCNSCDNMVKVPSKKCQECKDKLKPKVITKTCPTCETEFVSTVHNKKYCKPSHSPVNKESSMLSKRSRRKKRTAAKLSIESWNDINKFRKLGPENMHMDHIIPLNHPDVCGLHNTWNFQWLTPEENMSKSNDFDGTTENNRWKNKFED